MRLFRLAIGFVLTVAFSLQPSPGIAVDDSHADQDSSAAETPRLVSDAPLPTISDLDALGRDAASYARDYGVSIEEALRRLVAQEGLGEQLVAAGAMLPDRFAGAWIVHEPDYHGVVWFTGSADGLEPIAAFVGLASFDIEVRIGAMHSYDELLQGLERLEAALDDYLPDIGAYLDVRTGELVLVSDSAIEIRTLASLTIEAGVPVRIEGSPRMVREQTYGGKRLTFGGDDECTTGYTVQNTVTQLRGVITAGHCSNPLAYWPDGDTSYSLTLMGVRLDADQDVEWDRNSSHTHYPLFWDGSAYRTLHADVARLSMPGDYVCHFGIATGFSCGVVQTIHYDPGPICGQNENEPCAATWVQVEGSTLRCGHGDSGGPWFLGTGAYGIHTAGMHPYPGSPDCDAALFMSIGFITEMNLATLKG